jgi:YHS domain-containing protein
MGNLGAPDDRNLRTRDDACMDTTRPIAPDEDPVCGMHVDIDAARAKGLSLTHDEHDYVFCGKGCFLEFRDDPDTFLDPGHAPSM